MKFKKVLSALLVCVMVTAMLPLGVINASADDAPVITLYSAYPNPSNPYYLTVSLFANKPCTFIYAINNIPCGSQFINSSGTTTIQVPLNYLYNAGTGITGAELSGYIEYNGNTYYNVNRIQIGASSSYGTTNLTNVSVTANSSGGTFYYTADRPCYIFYAVSTSSNAPDRSSGAYNSQTIINAGNGSFAIYDSSLYIFGARIYYYTTDGYNNSQTAYVTVNGGTGSYGAPVISGESLTMSYNGYATFSFNTTKGGTIYLATSSSNYESKNSLLFTGQTVQTGSNTLQLASNLFQIDTYLYYYIKDTDGRESELSKIRPNTSNTNAPALTSVSLSSNYNNPMSATFAFNSDKTGYIYYAVSNKTGETTSSLYYSPAQITPGSNSFAINDNLLQYSGARVYYYTSDANFENRSQLSYVILNGGTSGTITPTLTNVLLSTYGNSVLSFTSDKAGILYYALSTQTNANKDSLSFNSYAFAAGQNSIYVNSSLLSTPGVRLYYYTVDQQYGTSSPLAQALPNVPTGGNNTVIADVKINDIVAPATGKTPSTAYTIGGGDNRYTVSGINWYLSSSNDLNQNSRLSSSDKFIAGLQYYVALTLTAKQGYSFPTDYNTFNTLKINDQQARLLSNSASTVTIGLLFDKLAAPVNTNINSVIVNGIDEPVAGRKPGKTGTTGNNTYKIDRIEWNPATDTFAKGKTYTVNVTLIPAEGYKFNTTSWKIGSRDASLIYEAKDGSMLVISSTYTLEPDWINPFTDVDENSRYYVYIKYCSINKLFNGITATTFGPTTTMNRAMFVTVLGRLAGIDVNLYKNKPRRFSDVDPKDTNASWYAPYVEWAVQNQITTGYDNGKFGVNDPVTREQMCTFLLRYAKYAGIKLGYTKKDIKFPDKNKISSYAVEAVSIYEQAGVAVSKPNTTEFNPTTNALRQEISELLILFMVKYMNG